MSKKQFQLFFSVLLSITILLGQLSSLSQFLPLRAAENQSPLVSLKMDGKAMDSKETVTNNQVIHLEMTAKQTGFYALAFDPEGTMITPLESIETLLPLENFQTFEQETFDVRTWQSDVLGTMTQNQMETETTTSPTDALFESSTVESTAEVTSDEAFLPFQTTTEDGKAGTLYFYLEKGATQTLEMTHAESKEQVFELELLPIDTEESEKQLLYTYQSAEETADTNQASTDEVDESSRQEKENETTASTLDSINDSNATVEKEPSPVDDATDGSDQSALARFDVFTEKSSYLIGEEAVGYIALTMNQGTGNLKDAVIEIRMPKEYLRTAPVGSSFALASNVETILDGEEYVIRYQVPNIEAGYEGQIPFRFRVAAGITPGGYQLPITATVIDVNQKEEAKAETKVPYKKYQPSLIKQVKSDNGWVGPDNYTVTAGSEDPNNPGYFPSEEQLDLLRPIHYRFTHDNYDFKRNPIGYRTYESWTIEDTIPEEALFRSEDNPDWSFDPATRIASYQGILTYDTISSSYYTYVTNYSPELVLYYPAAKLDHRVTNTGTATFIPYEEVEGEEHPQVKDDVTHSLVEYKRPTGYVFSKSGGWLNYDTLAEKEATKVNWSTSISNPRHDLGPPEAMENLRIRDYNQDDQLMFQTVQVTAADAFQGTVTIRLILDDGSEVILTDDYAPVSYYEKPSSPILTVPDNTKEVIMTSNEGSTLASPGGIELRLTSVYRDPVNTTLDDPSVRPSMRNYAQGSGNYVNGGHRWTASDSDSHTLRPVNPHVTLTKSRTAGPSPLFVGDQTTYRLDVNHSYGVPDQWVKEPVLIDLLPEGFDYVPGTTSISHYEGRYFTYAQAEGTYEKEPELIPNYENTGRTALRWYLPEWAYKGSSIYWAGYSPYRITYKTEVTPLAKEGVNRNNAYLGWTNNTEIRPASTITGGTTDIYDVNENGDRTDKIAASSAMVDYRAPIELITTKEVQGNLDNGYVFEPMTGKTEIASTGSYRLRLLNNSIYDIEHVQLLDVLPHVGDTTVSKDAEGNPYPRLSEFPVTLSGPVEVPTGFKIFYSPDLAPNGSDYSAFYESATWQETPGDYSQVRAIKIVMDANRKFVIGDRLAVEVPLQVAKDYDLTSGQLAVNSFGVSTDAPDVATRRYFESNNARIEIVRYEVTGHVFRDQNLDSEIGTTESRFANHTVALVDDEGQPVLDLEGQPITAKTDANGYYKMDVYRQGKYRVKILPPEGFTLTEPKAGETMSNIYLDQKEHLSDAFTLNATTRKAIRNGGYYDNQRPIYLYKYDASSVVDSNGDGVIDDAERRNGTPLAGAIFEVYEGTVVDPAKKLKNEDGTALQLTTGADGKVSFTGQLSGDYVLVEIKAPNGFELSKEPILLKNVNTEIDDELWVYISNDVQTQLPFTGSNRPFEYLLITFTSFFLIGMLVIAYQWRPRRHKGGE